jgi:hypothetical protein
MMLIKHRIVVTMFFLVTFISYGFSSNEIGERKNVELTVYNQDFALVKENRDLELKNGINKLLLEDVAAQIDPTSVHFKSLTDPSGTYVIEQNYDYDLVNTDKLMEKYIGKEIQLEQVFDGKRDILDGTLLASGQRGTVVKINDKIYINPSGTMILPKLSEGLILKPTLEWTVSAKKEGQHQTELSYITNGIKWNADYVIVTDKDDKTLDLTGWVTLDNRSGVAYENAKLKLMAGDVHLVNPPQQNVNLIYSTGAVQSASDKTPQFQEKGFSDYHLYTLQRPATILDNQTKQIELNHGENVPFQKIYTYDGAQLNGNWENYNQRNRTAPKYGTQSNKKVNVIMEFKNSEKNNLGMPLPAGKIRVYKKDEDGSQEFVGEDKIEHAPKDETIRLYTGNAFDVVGERKQTFFKMVVAKHVYDETFEIRLRNHKNQDVTVRVPEHLYRWSDWEITEKSQEFTKTDSKSIEFNVPVPKDGETVVSYTVRYTW